MFALIVKSGYSWNGGLKPRVEELSRDCPKTLFTLTGSRWGGENRYNKDGIRYRLFDTEEEAQAAIPDEVSAAIGAEKTAYDELDRSRKHREEQVQQMMSSESWQGGLNGY